MTPAEKARSLLRQYVEIYATPPTLHVADRHTFREAITLADMFAEGEDVLPEDMIRQLGYMQGVLVSLAICTRQSIDMHNRDGKV